ncbi:dipeptidyl peptidase III [Aspergillus californicus]
MCGSMAVAMSSPAVFQLSVASAFNSLDRQERLYAHYMAKAAWRGTRIILRQVSPESNGIFDLIIALYRSCKGDWDILTEKTSTGPDDIQKFLDYAALFLSNIGNYFGSGDQKFVPGISKEALMELASNHPSTRKLLSNVIDSMYTRLPNLLGPPGPLTQTTYYLGDDYFSSPPDVISSISELMKSSLIHAENTRIHRYQDPDFDCDCYVILQASVDESTQTFNSAEFEPPLRNKKIKLVRGDHKDELDQICKCLRRASKYASNRAQKEILQKTMDSFMLGDLDLYNSAQKIWVTDKHPPVETVIGFVEPYRDPLGVRAEFEGIVGIVDPVQTELLRRIAYMAGTLMSKLPWVERDVGVKGSFEKDIFDSPDISSIQTLAYASSNILPGINLPKASQRSFIHQHTSSKTIILSDYILAKETLLRASDLIPLPVRTAYQAHRSSTTYIHTTLRKLFEHRFGNLLAETFQDTYNFDITNPPLNPLTGAIVNSWYRLGQSFTSIFGDLATTVDECRAELVGAFLFDEPEVLALFGYTEESAITPNDLVYNLYLQLGVNGLRSLADYNSNTKKWNQAQSQAHYAIFRNLLLDAPDLYTVHCNPQNQTLTVQVDQCHILDKGKPCLGQMLLRLHIYCCTADISNCRGFYERMSCVGDEALEWRKIVLAQENPPLAIVHANTYLSAGDVMIKDYEPSARGIIQSWAEREIL